MKNKPIFVIVLLFAVSCRLFAQKEANNWYFGYHAGLSFNSSPPKALTDGAINTDEGCASISNHAGDLLFYTDGISVWNKTHHTMPNGTGLFGHPSATQSGIIVPFPNNNRFYYIFTVDCWENGLTHGIRYNVVDMKADGGRGDIISKNNLLLSPACEKVTVVQHASKRAYWLIMHRWMSDSFYIFTIDFRGIHKIPAKQRIGPYIGPVDGDWGSAAGYLKASPNGKILAMGNNAGKDYDVFTFDNENGILTSVRTFSTSFNAYGLEFSPNSRYLYTIQEDGFESVLNQYDLTNLNFMYFGVKINRYTDQELGISYGLQLGPDNKIYVTRVGASSLDVIAYPDNYGISCRYVMDSIPLKGKTCRLGLPNLIKSYVKPGPFAYEDTCVNNVTQFYIPDTTLVDSAWWRFDINSTSASDSATGIATSHTYTKPGFYTIRLTEFIGIKKFYYYTTIQIGEPTTPYVNFKTNDTLICGSSFMLKAYAKYAYYLWQDGSTDSFFNATASGVYKVLIYTPCDVFEDSIKITFFNESRVNFGPGDTICEGDSIVLNAAYPLSTFTWQDGSKKPYYTVKTTGLYNVKITNTCGNYDVAVKEQVNDCNCYLYTPNVFTPDGDSLNDIFKPSYCIPTQYVMKIFNRWGEEMFETKDINQGWDGTYHHQKVPEGPYIFYIQARNWDKNFLNRRGILNVVYPKR